MSLEQAIQENTAAIKALIAALGTGATTQAAAPVETATVAEPKVEKPAKEKKQQAPAAMPESKEEAAAAAAAGDPAPVSYDDCAQAVTKLAKSKGRPAAVALLGEFGLKTLQDAKDKPEVLARVKVAADAALGE